MVESEETQHVTRRNDQRKWGRLAPSTSLDMAHYLKLREANEFRGISWFDGRLESVALPRASTGSMGKAGHVYLRAITLLLISIGQSASVVGAEEYFNRTRKSRIDDAYHKLYSEAAGEFRVADVQEIEILIIGLSDWVMTPPSKRAPDIYTTRSSIVWYFAIALFSLGFDVHSSPTLISSQELYMDRISHQQTPTVILVSWNDRETDYMVPTSGITQFFKAKASVMVTTINTIPQVIFRHIHQNLSVTNEQLSDIWEDTFEYASSTIGVHRCREAAMTYQLNNHT